MAAPSTATAAMPASTVPVQRPGEAFFEFVAHMTRESAAKKELIGALGGIGIAGDGIRLAAARLRPGSPVWLP